MRLRIQILLLVLCGCFGGAATAQETCDPRKLTKQEIPELTQRAEAGDAMAQCRLAEAYYSGYVVDQNYSESADWFRKAAEQGIVESQFMMGLLYGDGTGVPKSKNEAMDWYRKAAEQGHANAQVNLGFLYYERKQYDDARIWYEKAAEQGDWSAPLNLADMYVFGHGVPQDPVIAYMWITLARAARCGEPPKLCVEQLPVLDERTIQLRDRESKHLSPEQVAEARRRAAEWLAEHHLAPLPAEVSAARETIVPKQAILSAKTVAVVGVV